MDKWIGKWWVCIWNGKYKIIEIGLGEDHGELQNTVCIRRLYRLGPVWLSVFKPTLRALTNDARFVGES